MFWFYSSTDPPLEGETAIFLHGQEKIWKGFINMHSVAKFATKAFLVSGSFEYLKEVGAIYTPSNNVSFSLSVNQPKHYLWGNLRRHVELASNAIQEKLKITILI